MYENTCSVRKKDTEKYREYDDVVYEHFEFLSRRQSVLAMYHEYVRVCIQGGDHKNCRPQHTLKKEVLETPHDTHTVSV